MFLKKVRLLLVVCAVLLTTDMLRAELTPAEKERNLELIENAAKSPSKKSLEERISFRIVIKDLLEITFRRPIRGVEKTALACGYITSLAIISRFIQQPTGLWEFFVKAFCVSLTVSFTGKYIADVYYPVFDMLYHPFSDDSKDNLTRDNLAILIAQWDKVKKDLPAPLRAKFDRFCQDYEKNGQLKITEEQAMALVKEITQEINRAYARANHEPVNPGA